MVVFDSHTQFKNGNVTSTIVSTHMLMGNSSRCLFCRGFYCPQFCVTHFSPFKKQLCHINMYLQTIYFLVVPEFELLNETIIVHSLLQLFSLNVVPKVHPCCCTQLLLFIIVIILHCMKLLAHSSVDRFKLFPPFLLS